MMVNIGYPLVDVYITVENYHFGNVIHYKMVIFFNSKLLVYQRVLS